MAALELLENDDNYKYSNEDLGILCKDKNTVFKIWAPTARRVEIVLYEDEDNENIEAILPLKETGTGIWRTRVEESLAGYYYLYKIHFAERCVKTIDPNARAVGTDSRLGLIVDFSKTDPPGWKNDSRIKLDNPVDAIIYELHVRDFSMSEESGNKNRGKYLAFTEKGTRNSEGYRTGIDHLEELGITHVHLLPVFDFATVSDNGEDYNWGYDPYFFNTPEGSYATDPSDTSRITEFKKMVKSLHDRNIGVIMDVVYNHTYHTQLSPFQLTVPEYYYRYVDECDLANGSGCGNELATEKAMMRKFIIDSVRFWAEEYHIDGFRFDLMRLIDKKTMQMVKEVLHDIDPSILIYGEPWSALPPGIEIDKQMYKGQQQGMKIAVFNDEFRNSLKGDNDGHHRGFISGQPGCEEGIKRGVVGGIEYSEALQGFALKARETVNYVSSHDNLTLWDKLERSNGKDDEELRIKMDRMAQAIIFTSQGIPFIQGGEEFLRTKYGNHNSYNAGDKINQLKWERKSEYIETFHYYQGLITLRKEHPAFRMKGNQQIREHLRFLEAPPGTVVFLLGDHANGDQWKDILVLYNPHRHWVKYKFDRKRKWNIVVDDKRAGVESFNSFKANNVKVPPVTAMVLYNK